MGLVTACMRNKKIMYIVYRCIVLHTVDRINPAPVGNYWVSISNYMKHNRTGVLPTINCCSIPSTAINLYDAYSGKKKRGKPLQSLCQKNRCFKRVPDGWPVSSWAQVWMSREGLLRTETSGEWCAWQGQRNDHEWSHGVGYSHQKSACTPSVVLTLALEEWENGWNLIKKSNDLPIQTAGFQ